MSAEYRNGAPRRHHPPWVNPPGCPRSPGSRERRSARTGAEALEEHPVTEPPVAHGQRILTEALHDGPDDAGAGQDHLGPLRLDADDGATSFSVEARVALDLAVALGPLEPEPTDPVRVVAAHRQRDGRGGREGSPHPDEAVRTRPPGEPVEVPGDRGQRLVEPVTVHHG